MTNHIDNFWEMFASSKCKTAMLMITMIIFAAVAYSECLGKSSDVLRAFGVGIVSYWGGRTSKAQENMIRRKR